MAEMEEIQEHGYLQPYYSNVTELETLIRDHEKLTFSKFISYRKDGKFGQNEYDPHDKGKHHILWNSNKKTNSHSAKIEFDGIPYIIIGIKTMGCHRGRDKCKRQKLKVASQREQKLADSPTSKIRSVITSKKLDCPAKVHCTQVVKFPDFKIKLNAPKNKEKASKALRKQLEEAPDEVEWEMRYYYRLPNKEDHTGHPYGQEDIAGCKKERLVQLDPMLEEKVKQLLMEGETDTDLILRQCRLYSKDVIFAGQKISSKKENRQFFPVKAQVQKCIDKIVYGVEDSLSDDEDFTYLTGCLNDKDIARPLKRLRRENRCLLHQIFATTYNLQDDNLLKQLRHNLQTLLISLKKCMPEQQYIEPPRRKRKLTKYSQTKGGPPLKKLKPLPEGAKPEKLFFPKDKISQKTNHIDDNTEKESKSNTAEVLMSLASIDSIKTAPDCNVHRLSLTEVDSVNLEELSRVKKEKEDIEKINKAVESIKDDTVTTQLVYHFPSSQIESVPTTAAVSTFPASPQSNIDVLCQAAQITPELLQESITETSQINNTVFVKSESGENRFFQIDPDGSAISNQIVAGAEGGEVGLETVTYTVEHAQPDGRKFFIQVPATASWSDQEIANIVSQVLTTEQKSDLK